MQKLTLFYLEGCPYCHNARKAYRELVDGDAQYGRVEVDWVEESEHPEISEQYNYPEFPEKSGSTLTGSSTATP